MIDENGAAKPPVNGTGAVTPPGQEGSGQSSQGAGEGDHIIQIPEEQPAAAGADAEAGPIKDEKKIKVGVNCWKLELIRAVVQ